MVGEEHKRMQEPGVWPHRTIPGHMLLHLTGDILQNSAAQYITDRINMLQILVPAGVVELQRKMGKIRMQYTGQEVMQNDCTLDAYPSLPMQALYPSVTEFQVTFKVFDPFMIGVSGKRYMI